MKPSRPTVILLLAITVTALFSMSCGNTLRGAGRDVENVGDSMQKATR